MTRCLCHRVSARHHSRCRRLMSRSWRIRRSTIVCWIWHQILLMRTKLRTTIRASEATMLLNCVVIRRWLSSISTLRCRPWWVLFLRLVATWLRLRAIASALCLTCLIHATLSSRCRVDRLFLCRTPTLLEMRGLSIK